MSDPVPDQRISEYSGSHGTSRSRSRQIQEFGFAVGKERVRKGKGVYLWQKCRNWQILAAGWYLQQKSRNTYSRDPDPRGVVLYVIARVPEDHYIDLCEQEIVDAIDELADRAHIDKNDRDQIAAVYERFIMETEKKLGNIIDLFKTEVSPPAQEFCPEYSTRLSGLPKCYCVRRPEVLTIADIEEIA